MDWHSTPGRLHHAAIDDVEGSTIPKRTIHPEFSIHTEDFAHAARAKSSPSTTYFGDLWEDHALDLYLYEAPDVNMSVSSRTSAPQVSSMSAQTSIISALDGDLPSSSQLLVKPIQAFTFTQVPLSAPQTSSPPADILTVPVFNYQLPALLQLPMTLIEARTTTPTPAIQVDTQQKIEADGSQALAMSVRERMWIMYGAHGDTGGLDDGVLETENGDGEEIGNVDGKEVNRGRS